MRNKPFWRAQFINAKEGKWKTHNEIMQSGCIESARGGEDSQPFLGVGNGPSPTLHILCYFSPISLLVHALCGGRVVSLMCIPIDTARYHLVTVGLLPGMCC